MEHATDEMRTFAIACCSPPQNSCEHLVVLFGRVSNSIHHALHYDGNIEQLGSARRALALQSSAPRPHPAQTNSQVHFDRRDPAALVQISP
jgi:hypothetical protein